MRKLFLALLTVCLIMSCSKEGNEIEKQFDSEKYPQKWTLIEMSGQIPNSEATGENMEWQEYYILKSDGTFIKHREWDGIDSDATGTFSFVNINEDKFIELVHAIGSDIVGSCYGNQNESLWLKSDKKLTGTWSACDGPGLVYERIE